MKNLIFATAFSLSVLLLCACSKGAANYPLLLVEADSAFVRGDYDVGNSLMEAYRPKNEDDATTKFRQLVTLEQSYVHSQLDYQHFTLADSLCHYYAHHDTRDKYVKSLLCLGSVYYAMNSYPTAMELFLHAEDIAFKNGYGNLLCFIYRERGDLYFRQRMLDDCLPCYRKYYNQAIALNDTLRIAMSASSMGRYYTVTGNVDSTIYYYKQAIDLGEAIKQKSDVAYYAKISLCDIYIQIEEYDSALAIMPRDELNEQNWAYWHYGQGHLDSASYYFQKVLGKHGWQADVDYLRELVGIEKQRGNIERTLAYYNRLVDAEDSLRVLSQEESTRRIEAQYNYDTIKKEKEKIESDNQWMKKELAAIGIVGFLFLLVLFFVWQLYKQKKKREIEHERHLRREEENRSRQSQEQLEKNLQRLAQLEKQLAEVKSKGADNLMLQQVQYEKDLLTAESQSIEAKHRHQQFLQEEFKKSHIYIRIKENASNINFVLTEDDWSELADGINKAYDHFTSRLLDLADLRDTEIRICQLLKIGVKQVDVARLIRRSKSTVNSNCKSILSRLTSSNGVATELSTFLKDF